MSTLADLAALLQKSEETNLKHKTRIIELENQLTNQSNKAKQYEIKFRQATLQSQFSEGQDLLQKLNLKEKELSQCRKENVQLNKKLMNSSQAPTLTDLVALARQNEELVANIQDIKSAAISAIMAKEQQIEQLSKSLQRYETLQSQLKYQQERSQTLQKQMQLLNREKDQQVAQLNDKISRERQEFFNKIQSLQGEATQDERYKESLLAKAQHLEGTVELHQTQIAEYQNSIHELEHSMQQLRNKHQQESTKLKLQLQDMKQAQKGQQKQEKSILKIVEQLKNKDKNNQQRILSLTQINEQLSRKLSIKKKKDNKSLRDKLNASFSGIAKHNPVYASFAYLTKNNSEDTQTSTLAEVQDLGDMIENINFGDLQPQNSSEVPISQLMSKKKKSSEVGYAQASIAQTSGQPIKSQVENSKETQSLKQNILRLQTEKKEIQNSLKNAYTQIQKLNQQLQKVVAEVQNERSNTAQLRQKMKKTKKQAQLVVQMQSLQLHVQKLQNDMVASKLKYAQSIDFTKEKYNRQKMMWTEKLMQLTDRIAQQDMHLDTRKDNKDKEKSQKKKKGFFG